MTKSKDFAVYSYSAPHYEQVYVFNKPEPELKDSLRLNLNYLINSRQQPPTLYLAFSYAERDIKYYNQDLELLTRKQFKTLKLLLQSGANHD